MGLSPWAEAFRGHGRIVDTTLGEADTPRFQLKDEYEDVRDQLARGEAKLDALIAETELGRRDGQT